MSSKKQPKSKAPVAGDIKSLFERAKTTSGSTANVASSSAGWRKDLAGVEVPIGFWDPVASAGGSRGPSPAAGGGDDNDAIDLLSDDDNGDIDDDEGGQHDFAAFIEATSASAFIEAAASVPTSAITIKSTSAVSGQAASAGVQKERSVSISINVRRAEGAAISSATQLISISSIHSPVGWLEQVNASVCALAESLAQLEAQQCALSASPPALRSTASVSIESSGASSSSAAAISSSCESFLRLAKSSSESVYTLHLRHIITSVANGAATRHLLTEPELRLAASIGSLSSPAAGLLARLASRKGPWFRTASFKRYPELLQRADSRSDATTGIALRTTDDEVVLEVDQPQSGTVAGTDATKSGSSPSSARKFGPLKENVPPSAVRAAVSELVAGGLLFSLPLRPEVAAGRGSSSSSSSSLSATAATSETDQLSQQLEAITCCFTSAEVKSVLTRLGVKIPTQQAAGAAGGASAGANKGSAGSSAAAPQGRRKSDPAQTAAKGGGAPSASAASINASASASYASTSATTRPAMLSLLFARLATQRTIWGGRLPLGKAITAVIQEFGSGLAEESASESGAVVKGSDKDQKNDGLAFVRLSPSFLSLLRRCHGLFYLVTATAHLSSGQGTGVWPLATPAEAATSSVSSSSSGSTGTAVTAITSTPSASNSSSSSIGATSRAEPSSTVVAYRGHFGSQKIASSSSGWSGSTSMWANGSGSKYADSAAASDSFLPAGSGAGAGSVIAAGLGANGGWGGQGNIGGLYAPAMLQVFKKLDFPRYATNASLAIFPVRSDLCLFEAAHLLRAQVDSTAVLGCLPPLLQLNPAGDRPGDDENDEEADGAAAAGTVPLPSPTGTTTGISLTAEALSGLRRAVTSADNGVAVSPAANAPASSSSLPPTPPLPWPALAGFALLPYAALLVDRQYLRQWLRETGLAIGGSASSSTELRRVAEADVVLLSQDDGDDDGDAMVPAAAAAATVDVASASSAATAQSVPASCVLDHCLSLALAAARRLGGGSAATSDCDIRGAGAAPSNSASSSAPGTASEGGGNPLSVPLEDVGCSALATVISLLLSDSSSGDRLVGYLQSIAPSLPALTAADAVAIATTAPPALLTAFRCSLALALTHAHHRLQQASESGASSDLTRHPWLHQLTSPSILSTIVWEAVDPLERARCYPHTIPLLVQLVSLPFTPHRSGRWWARLCLNLSHLGLHADAAGAASLGLASRHVRAGERLALSLRQARLIRVLAQRRAKEGEQQAAAGAASGRQGKKSSKGKSTGKKGSAATASSSPTGDVTAATTAADDESAMMSLLSAGADASSSSASSSGAAATVDPDLPLYHSHLRSLVASRLQSAAGSSASSLSTGGSAVLPLPIGHDTFIRRPLARVVGQKSWFVSDIDHDNDGAADGAASSSSLSAGSGAVVNITDRVCAAFGWTYPHGPERHVYNPQTAPAAAEEAATATSTAAAETTAPKPVGDEGNLASSGPIIVSSDGVASSEDIGMDDSDVDDAAAEETIRSSIHPNESSSASAAAGAAAGRVQEVTQEEFDSFFDEPWQPAPNTADATSAAQGSPSVGASSSSSSSAAAAAAAAVAAPAHVSLRIGVEELALQYYFMGPNNIDAEAEGAAAKASDGEMDVINLGDSDDDEDGHDDNGSTSAAIDGAASRDPLSLSSGGWRGVHCEGALLHCLWALLMWEVIFPPAPSSSSSTSASAESYSSSSSSSSLASAVPDTFLTPYQDAPLDLDSPGVFYANRQAGITTRLLAVAAMGPDVIAAELGRVWRQQYGRVCRGMRWDSYPLGLLQLVAVGLGGPSLACLCDALCFNHKQLTGGLPDLLLWRVLFPASSLLPSLAFPVLSPHCDLLPSVHLPPGCVVQVRLSEVKGPRDTLSEKQMVWLRLLTTAGIHAGVCKITEPKERKPRKQKQSAGGRKAKRPSSGGASAKASKKHKQG